MITILEGVVSGERWQKLEDSYRLAIRKVPKDLIQTFLVQDRKDRNIWRIISVWRGEIDPDDNHFDEICITCVDIFRGVGVEPTRRKFDVVAKHMKV